ncbi:MAG: leucine-rich repeat domain-containing protein, partial [Lachnospiraceae bacterium]|nr:leucine-rich repeat domain-containing protein [Lachnospiraceae bacterium]
ILPVDRVVTYGRIKVNCKQCDTIYSATVPTEYSIYWSRKGSSYYYSDCESEYDVGETLRCICSDTSDADLGEMEIISQDTRVITVTEDGYLNFIADGIVSVEVRPKYNPSIGRTFTFYVGNVKEEEKDKNDNKTENTPNKDKDDTKTEDVTEHYDPATGMTVCVKDKSKKTAVLTSVDTKHIKKTLSIPNKVILDGTSYTITEIGKKAFKNNKKLEKVVIGDKVETIGAEAFSGCKKLKTVTIGKNVKTIGSKAFYKCKKLKSITIKTKKLTSKTVGSKAFKDIYAKASIKVPKSKLAAYKKLLKTKGVGKKAKIKK